MAWLRLAAKVQGLPPWLDGIHPPGCRFCAVLNPVGNSNFILKKNSGYIKYIGMKNLLNASNAIKSMLLTIEIMFTVSRSTGQQIKPSNSGYAAVNGIKVYYEVYLPTGQAGGEGSPIVLLHGAFYTIDMNWSELIPVLSKTRKVIAIEMQGHGH